MPHIDHPRERKKPGYLTIPGSWATKPSRERESSTLVKDNSFVDTFTNRYFAERVYLRVLFGTALSTHRRNRLSATALLITAEGSSV
jgi:hypothetical protein